MTHLSKKKISDKTTKAFQDALIEVFQRNSKNEAKKAISLLLSETEVKMISKRLVIMHMLSRGEKVDNIANVTKVTRQTIGRIALSLKTYSTEDKKFLFSKLKKWERGKFAKGLAKTILNTDISYTTQVKKLKGLKT